MEKAGYPKGDINFTPSAAVIYQPHEHHLLKLMFGKAVRENYLSGTQVAVDVAEKRSDVYIEAEESYTTELNYLMTLSGKIGLNLSFFYTELNNVVIRKFVINDGVFTGWFENEGKRKAFGTEFLLKTKPFKNFNFDIGASFIDSRDEYLDIDRAFSPDFIGQAKMSYVFGKYSAAISANYVDEMETDWNENKTSVMDESNTLIGFESGRHGDKTDSHILFNMNLLADEIFDTGLFAKLSINNLFAEKIKNPDTGGNRWANKGFPEEGREYKFSIGYEF